MPINRIFNRPHQMSDPIILRKHPRYLDASTNGFHLLLSPVEALAFNPAVGGHYRVSVRGICEKTNSVEVVCVEDPFADDIWIINMIDLGIANRTSVKIEESAPAVSDSEFEERIQHYRTFIFFTLVGTLFVGAELQHRQLQNQQKQVQPAEPDIFKALKKQGIDVKISDAIRKKLLDRGVQFDATGNMILPDSGIVKLYVSDRSDTKVYRVDAYDQPEGIITVMILSIASDGTYGDTQVIHIGPDGLERI